MLQILSFQRFTHGETVLGVLELNTKRYLVAFCVCLEVDRELSLAR